jgi:hypothetical protein
MFYLQTKAVQLEFPDTRVVWEAPDKAYFEFPGPTVQGGNEYCLRLYVNPELPEVCPTLFCWSPLVLRRLPDGTVNELGRNHDFHTWDNGPDARVCICHIALGDWDASISYVTPITKGHLWILAYEAHLQDGSLISEYFR